jgi:peptide deformylase
MSILNLVLYPDEPLLQVAEPYETYTPELGQLAQDMLETMQAHEGVGLAGPQVGIAKRIFVMYPPEGEPRCLINPEILEKEGSELGEEGCLSLPQLYGQVPRATRLRVRALDHAGKEIEFEATDFEARIIQHEYDHLDGILFIDHIDVLSRQAALQEWDAIRSQILEAK